MTRNRRRIMFGAASAAMVVVAAAACSSSGGSGTAADHGTATGSPIKVMATGTLSSPNLSYPETADGARAAATAINKAGGVDGHPIEVVTCNDGLDPNKAASCVQQAVQEKVTALVGGIDLFSGQLWPSLHAAGLPWVGISVISQDQGTDSSSYPLTAGTPGAFMEAGRLAVEHGGKNVVILRHENPQSAYVADAVSHGVTLAGGSVVKTVTSNIGTPDTTSAAAQVVGAHPDAVGCACNAGDGARLLKSLRQAGFTGPFTASESTLPQSDVSSIGAAADNVWLASDSRGADDPKAAQFVAEVKAVNPSANTDNVASNSWLAVHTVANLLKGKSSPSAATLIAALNAGPIDTADFAGPTFSFAGTGPIAGAPRIANPTVLDYTVKSGRITVVNGTFRNPLTGS